MSETQEQPPPILKASMQAPWEAMAEVRECSPPIFKMTMVCSLGGDDGGPVVLTTYLEGIDGGPLGGDARGLGAPTTYLEDNDGGAPWEAMMEVRERSPPILKMSMVGPLGGDVRDPGVPTTYPENFNGVPPSRRYQRSGGAHHLS
jgi:hypothetical protein